MRNYPKHLIALSVLAAASLTAAYAQQPGAAAGSQPVVDQPTATLRTKGPEILLAVTVRDKRGELVNNLPAPISR